MWWRKPEGAPARPRLAWIFPSLARSPYWQPVFREMARLFPGSVIYTGIWPGHIEGFEGTFDVQLLSGMRPVVSGSDPDGYRRTVGWVPPSLLLTLLRLRPEVVAVGGFGMALGYATILKWLTGCRIILLWDGNAPFTTFSGPSLRGRVRPLLAKALDVSVSNTVDGAVYLRDGLGLPAERVHQVLFQVPDPGLLSTRAADLSALRTAKRPMFLFVGRLLKLKGPQVLLEAARMLVDRGLDTFSIVLAGSGLDEPELRRQCTGLGLDERVWWMGERQYVELGSFFKACDVFVLPSMRELRGMVVSEAMCFGKAIICTRNTDLAELVFDGDNAFVFDPTKPEELADCMARFIQSPGLVERFGARSAAIVKPYTPAAAAAGIARAVAQALGRSGAHAS